jgi:quercetin dioxygenase-like cupin family protein
MKHIKGLELSAKLASANDFTGTVWIEPLSEIEGVQVLRVTFAPGARTAWHTHPKGQTLVITSGNGLFQKRGEAVQTMQQGDVIVIPANEEHWHGANSSSLMQHFAIQILGTKWLEHVSEEDYSSLKV